jgi:hypothetical protein
MESTEKKKFICVHLCASVAQFDFLAAYLGALEAAVCDLKD